MLRNYDQGTACKKVIEVDLDNAPPGSSYGRQGMQGLLHYACSGNYYQFTEYRNGILSPNDFVFEDRLSDGRCIQEYNATPNVLHR